MSVFYNETDRFAAAWLRRLIKAGHLPSGVVDETPIQYLKPSALDGFKQAHFFAGIGGWPLALRRAGWPDSRPIWTGSCPCQPFSSAGSGGGLDDERHLWPAMFDLVRQHRPRVVLGEQVSSPDGLEWLDVVSSDLEATGYACGAIDTCSASVGAPHIRQRLYWMGYADGGAVGEHFGELSLNERQHEGRRADDRHGAERAGSARELADSNVNGREFVSEAWLHDQGAPRNDASQRGASGFWADCDWVLCNDPGGERWRPIEPESFPLASRVPGDVGRLSGYGNAITVPVAEAFIASAIDALEVLGDPLLSDQVDDLAEAKL